MNQEITKPKQHISGLDHLRALAITLVFLFHYRLFDHPTWVDTIGSFGWTGVDLFFVLSGYLIASQIFKGLKAGTFSLYEFFLKRFFRILPAYWVVLSLYFLVPALREWESLPPLWKLLSFTQNFGLDLREHRTFSHAWSLCIEEQFYLFLPFILILLHQVKFYKKSTWLLFVLCIAGFAFRFFSWNHFVIPAMDTDAFGAVWYKWIYYPTYNRLDGLLAGIGIAAIYQYNDRLKRYISHYAGVLLASAVGLTIFAYIICEAPLSFNASIFGFPLVAVAFGLIVAVAANPDSILNRFASSITSRIATLSYAIYLTHKMAIHFAQVQAVKLSLASDGMITFILNIAVAVVVATILHYSIERPFLRIKEYILGKKEIAVTMHV